MQAGPFAQQLGGPPAQPCFLALVCDAALLMHSTTCSAARAAAHSSLSPLLFDATLQAVQSEPLPKLVEGEFLDIKEVELHQVGGT